MPNGNNKVDAKKLEGYQKILLALKEKISGDIRTITAENSSSTGDDSHDISGHAQHMADVATDMYDRELNLSLASNDREILKKIDNALFRVKEGSYGNCVSCKKPIPSARLEAIPYTETCLKCQEMLEQNSGRPGRS